MDTEEALGAELERSGKSTGGAAPSWRVVEPAILLASSCSALSARLLCHPRTPLSSGRGRKRLLTFLLTSAVDTLRIRIQTGKKEVRWRDLKNLVPKPRLQGLYAGTYILYTMLELIESDCVPLTKLSPTETDPFLLHRSPRRSRLLHPLPQCLHDHLRVHKTVSERAVAAKGSGTVAVSATAGLHCGGHGG
jgi:hypothetical protein